MTFGVKSNEMENTQNEAIMTYFKVLSWHLTGQSKGNQKNYQNTIPAKFKPSSTQIQVR
jgi:hypothetical protein